MNITDITPLARVELDLSPITTAQEAIAAARRHIGQVGAYVRAVRVLCGDSQAAVAEAVDIRVNRLGQIEAGHASPTIEEADDLLAWAGNVAASLADEPSLSGPSADGDASEPPRSTVAP